MRRSGSADLPLHYGHVPQWLAQRMAKLGLAITEAVLVEYGKETMLKKLSDPLWFQSFGAVMGMDWHSSGITTSVMGALKRSINPHSKSLGLYICGGKGRHSKQTPDELVRIADKTGLDGDALVHASKLSAKVDNTAIQDGYQLYTHNFILADTGQWTVIQQGMHESNNTARRYHWYSDHIRSFVEQPHSGICGENQGDILDLTATAAGFTRKSLVEMTKENPNDILQEYKRLVLPAHHEVTEADVDLKKLGAALWLAQENQPKDFEELLSLQGVGPRTIQSLALVSEVIYGSHTRFRDPARFSFAHGGKDGHPFPVPTKVYDETIHHLQTAVEKAKVGDKEKSEAIRSLHRLAENAEKGFTPNQNFNALIEKERGDSWKYGGKTVFGDAKKPRSFHGLQLRMF